MLLSRYTYNRYSSEISYRRILIISNITFSVFHLADVVLFSRLNVKLGIPVPSAPNVVGNFCLVRCGIVVSMFQSIR